MDLNALLADFPSVRLASQEDGGEILEFYDRTALSGRSLKLRSVRSPDFFHLLRYQGDRYTVLVDRDDRNAIRGVATLVHRPGYLGGERRDITYLGDFRLAFDRRAMRVWRECYGRYLEASGEPTITCVIDENSVAQNALIHQNKAPFRYELLSPYRMINVLARAPWRFAVPAPKALGTTTRRAVERDLPSIREFLDRQSRARAFGYCFAAGELDRRLRFWDGLEASSFFLIERSGEILGCFALWSPSRAKSNVLESLPSRYQLYRPFVPFPRVGEALKAMYLTHLEIDRALTPEERRKIFGALFEHMAREAWDRSWHMLSFCDFPSADFARSLQGRYLIQTIPMKLFTVRHQGARPSPIDPESMREPGFEIALV